MFLSRSYMQWVLDIDLEILQNVFWSLSYTDVHRAISWDRLHAYHGGLFSNHLLEQVLEILDASDRRFSAAFEQQ